MQTSVQQCPSRVVTRRRLDQADVQIIDYQWKESFIFQDDFNSIHYRLMPFQLDIQSTLGERSGLDLGNILLLPAGSVLRVLVDKPGHHHARTLKCSFGPNWVERLLGESFDVGNVDIDNFLGVKNASARACLHRIALELLEPGFASDALIESLLQTAVIEIIRDTDGLPPCMKAEPSRTTSVRLSPAQLDRIMAMIEDSHAGIPSAMALAGELGISVSHFRRLFRATTGQSVHEFISGLIIEHAKGLLANSGLSMKEITYRLGFTSPSSFSVAFKRAAGTSPSQFRAQALS
jgi:AraC family transcriptional regulator